MYGVSSVGSSSIGSIGEGYLEEKSEEVLDGQWRDIAIDNGNVILEQEKYYAELTDGVDSTSVKINNISYSPTVNKAKNISIDVPSKSVLETTKYLGEKLKVYVGNKLLFYGQIIQLSTAQKEGDDYSIVAEPPGKKLKGTDIDENITNEIVYDSVGRIVDEHNDYSARHSELRDTENEDLYQLSHLGLDVLEGPGGVTYTGVGDPETIYVKCYTPSSSYIDPSFGDIIDDADKNRYGEWRSFSSLKNQQDEISFSISGEARLIDWVAIVDEQISREIYTPDIVEGSSESKFYSRDKNQLASNYSNIDDGIMAVSGDDVQNEVRTREVTQWANFDFDLVYWYDDGVPEYEKVFPQETLAYDATDNVETIIDRGERTPDLSNKFEDKIDPLKDYGIAFRARVEHDYTPNEDSYWDMYLNINGEINDIFTIPDDYIKGNDDYTWYVTDSFILNGSSISEINEFVLGTKGTSDISVAVDCVVFLHRLDDLDYKFSNSTNEEDYLEKPVKYAHSELYGSPQYIEFSREISQNNISSATVSSSFSHTSGLLGDWGIDHSIGFNSGRGYVKGSTMSDSVSSEFAYPGSSHSVRVALSSTNGPSDELPATGNVPQKINSISVEASYNDAEVISDKDISDNRLSAVNSLCNNTQSLIGFGGNKASIFQRGLLKSNVNLLKEDVRSTTDISEAYRSCKVKGKNGVEGDRIFADNIPDYIEKDKLIHDRGIESVEQANSTAKSFLRENGDISYEGEISTLPTLAPLGHMIDGSVFNHGQDMVIENVRYGKRRAKISLGFTKDISSQFIKMSEQIHRSNSEGTRKGVTIPTGEDNYSTRGDS